MLLAQTRCLRQYGLAVTLRRFSDSLHVTLEPLEEENEGIFTLTLNRASSRNAIGAFRVPVA